MTYQLLTNLDGTTSLVRTNADGSKTWIPQDPANSDYRTYLLTSVAVTPLTTEQQAEITEAPILATNRATIVANITSAAATVNSWIAANPTGAVLNAGEALVLAQLLNGIFKVLLEDFSSSTNT